MTKGELQQQAIDSVLTNLRQNYDARFLLTGLMVHAAWIAARLKKVGAVDDNYIANLYHESFNDATKEVEGDVKVIDSPESTAKSKLN